MILQALEGIKADMAAIRADPDLSMDQKKVLAEAKMQELYSVSGAAKIKGALEQVERALQEGTAQVLPCLGFVSLQVILYPHHLLSEAEQLEMASRCSKNRLLLTF